MRACTLLLLLALGCGARERMRAGDRYLAAGRDEAAVRAYSRAVEKRPGSARALAGLARASLAAGDPAGALDAASRASAEGAEEGPLLQAEALLLLGRGRESLPLLADQPASPRRDRLLAEARLAAGDRAGAVEAARSAAADPANRGLLAWLYAREGQAEDALSLGHRLTADPAAGDQARAEAAAALALAGERPAAVAVSAERMLRWRKEAAWRDQGGDVEGAAWRLGWLRAADPTNGEIAHLLGQRWLKLGEPAQARRQLEAAVTLDAPDPLGAWRDLARACQALGDHRCEGAALLQLALDAPQPTLDQWQAAAAAFRAAGDLESTMTVWGYAAADQPDDATYRYHLAGTLLELGRIDDAVGHARLAWQEAHGDASAGLLLGELYMRRKEYHAAIQVYRQALALHPDDLRLQTGLQTALGYVPY